MQHREIEFGWFLPTAGDTTAYGVAETEVKPTPQYLTHVAQTYDRPQPLAFGMRLQIICRETEDQAIAAAEKLIEHMPEMLRDKLKRRGANSEANQRVQALAAEKGDWIAPHLWSGLTRFRPGAGIAVVGDAQQCADTLKQFIDAGCTSFCLSGYLHDEEAERFGRLVRPRLNVN